MKHPFHIVLSSTDGELLFTAVQNQIQVFSTANGARVGHWIDEVDTTESLKEKVKKEQERQIKENEAEGKEPSKKKRKSNNTEPKVPTPGAGAPKVFNYIRGLHLTNDGKHLIAATDLDKAGVIFQINKDDDTNNVLVLIKRQPFPKRPSAITSSTTSTELLLGDKFGDVYSVPINSDASTEINSETEPILGHVSMLTDLTVGVHDTKQYVITCDRDEHIRVSNYPQGFIIKDYLFGHKEFVNCVVIPEDKPTMLLSAGGDDFLISWNWVEAQKLDEFNLRDIIEPYMSHFHLAPSKFQNETGDLKEICVSQIVPLGNGKVAVLVEHTKCVLIMNLNQEGKLSLDKIVDFPEMVIAITASSSDKLIASVESESDNILQVVDISTNEIVQDDGIAAISTNSTVEIASKDDLYPLYTVYQLRKRKEH
ncbi:hypothetical protein BON22_1934 [Cyberlindnera fabianii]|uniref:Uncharacterized protein n=1 Tax=Cyberlindnera fabianii TaxID=36022 RepID=A0A1V2LBF8_CYBFA|nr:hypothetical protein BON22_1934 [Cyberlindnera fabianii]